MKKNKDETKQKLLDAVGEIILSEGFGNIGINAVARKAGVDKVLIYRYFTNLNGLLKEYLLQEDFMSRLDQFLMQQEPIESKKDFMQRGSEVFIRQLRYLRASMELQEIMLWELNEKNDLTTEIARLREKQAIRLLSGMSEKIDFSAVDIPAISALMIGGIYYMVLRSRTVDVFNGVDLKSDEGWERIEKAVTLMMETLTEKSF